MRPLCLSLARSYSSSGLPLSVLVPCILFYTSAAQPIVHIFAALDLLRSLAWQRENHYFPIPVSLAYRRDEAAAGQTRVIVITFADVDFHSHGRVYVNTIIPAMTWAGGHRVPWFGDMADVNGRPGSLVFVQTQHWLRWNDGFPICKERYAPERVDICMKCGQDCLIVEQYFFLERCCRARSHRCFKLVVCYSMRWERGKLAEKEFW